MFLWFTSVNDVMGANVSQEVEVDSFIEQDWIMEILSIYLKAHMFFHCSLVQGSSNNDYIFQLTKLSKDNTELCEK